MEILSFSSHAREEMLDITAALRTAVAEHGWQNGVLTVFCPHTSCGLTINEGFDPDVVGDLTAFFRRLVPQSPSFRHAEGNSDAHIKASMLGSSLQILVEREQLLLGTWQVIWLFEGDGPRSRQIWLKWQGTAE